MIVIVNDLSLQSTLFVQIFLLKSKRKDFLFGSCRSDGLKPLLDIIAEFLLIVEVVVERLTLLLNFSSE